MDAARTEVSRVHTAAGRALIEHAKLLALLKAPSDGGQRANVHRLRRDVQDV